MTYLLLELKYSHLQDIPHMYYYYDTESEALWFEEVELDLDTLDDLVEPISEEDFYRIGKELDLLFFVSQSKVKTYRRCHKQYHYKYILKILKRLKGKPLMVGSIVHECIELWLKGKPWKDPIRKAKKEIKSMFVEEAIDYQDVITLTTGMIKGYIDNYENDGLTPTHVELEITVPLTDTIMFTGKVDSLQRESKKKYWQVEHKTCAYIPDEKNRMSDIQTVLYHWALPLAGYEPPIGVIWDYLRKKLPVVPQLLAKGGLSKAKNIDTTRVVYEQAIIDNDLDPEEYAEILANLEGREDSFHRRIRMPIAQSMVDSVVDDFRSTAIQMQLIGHTATDRNLTKDCSWCDYYALCQSDLRGGDTNQLLKRNYTTQEQRDAKEQNKSKKVRRKKSKKG